MTGPAASVAVCPVDVSIIVCTFNRRETVLQGLRSMEALDVPPSCALEIVVVDNASTDGTAAAVRRYAAQSALPIRIESVPHHGLSKARNEAASLARGRLLLFTDDDTLVDPGWVRAYVAAAQRWPRASFFGGRIVPRFEVRAAGWLRANMAYFSHNLAALDLGPQERIFADGEHPYGPNMAFRADVFSAARFDERVGRKRYGQVRLGDVSVFVALHRAGCEGVWVPEAVVEHRIPREHATVPYFLRRYFGAGVASERLKHEGSPIEPAPARKLGRAVGATLLALLGGRTDWAVYMTRGAHYAGVLWERGKGGKQ